MSEQIIDTPLKSFTPLETGKSVLYLTTYDENWYSVFYLISDGENL